MWNFFGRSHRYCDGLTRRSFLQVGGLGIGGLTLADLNAAELQKPAGTPSSRHKSVIMVYLSGGMPHRCSIVRSIVGQRDEHSSFQNLTGFTMGEVLRDGIPNFGSVVARVQGATNEVTPPFVDLFPTMQHRPYNSTEYVRDTSERPVRILPEDCRPIRELVGG